MNSNPRTLSRQRSKESQFEDLDLVILCGGTGSTIAAWTFAGEGIRVAVIEHKYIGGSCLNIACLPARTSSILRASTAGLVKLAPFGTFDVVGHKSKLWRALSRKAWNERGERQGNDESSISFQESRLNHKLSSWEL
jgi:pyruvate/2-oxoglutarate dehydrogenase complex dihydrolipoamide dehydrogenase (E3) component